jgi:glycosyltransferase involved in cell wall biosynthesis
MLWNGIDISRFRYCGGGDGPVLAVGRLSPEKDFATLIRAAAIAVSIDPTFRLDVAGDGVCMPELQQLVTELGIQHAVRLLGQRSDIQQLLAGARMAALSSVTEGISLTLLEAMASGLPVVATAVGGNPELVVNNLTGLLVPPQQPEILAKAMIDLWRDPVRRQAMGHAGRARVEEFFDVRKMVAEYEKLYLA